MHRTDKIDAKQGVNIGATLGMRSVIDKRRYAKLVANTETIFATVTTAARQDVNTVEKSAMQDAIIAVTAVTPGRSIVETYAVEATAGTITTAAAGSDIIRMPVITTGTDVLYAGINGSIDVNLREAAFT